MLKRFAVIIIVISVFALPCYCASVGDTVHVGGMAFGIKLCSDGILICGVSEVDSASGNISPGEIAGLKKGDIILSIDKISVTNVKEVIKILRKSEGKPMNISFARNNKNLDTTITPLKSESENSYKLGLWLKDGTSGIGTVTYIEDDGCFAGLGHGVCDTDTGAIMKLRDGRVTDITISGVRSSSPGCPGQLQGYFKEDTGYLSANTLQGVYGKFEKIPDLTSDVTIAAVSDIKEGPATILCTLDNNIISKYNIEIEKIIRDTNNTKNFVIKVTDAKLLERTGGIVQGMSGSPIIQNGKLIGAVTHVLVEDPTRGYGIFIENMLEKQ